MALDISHFRAVTDTSRGFVQLNSGQDDVTVKGTAKFFGAAVAYFSSSTANIKVKEEFLQALEQEYGQHFRQIAEVAVRPESGKPLDVRVVRDLLAMGESQYLRSQESTEPTTEFTGGTGGLQTVVKNLVAPDRQHVQQGARRFLEHVQDPKTNILSDVAKVVNTQMQLRDPEGLPPGAQRVTARDGVQVQFDLVQKHGGYGLDLARALGDSSGDKAFKSSLDAVLALKPSPLLQAFSKAYGNPGKDVNHPARVEPQRLEGYVNQFVGYVGLSMSGLQKEMAKGNEEGVRQNARELLSLLDRNVTYFKVAGEILTDPEFLRSVPPEHREALQARGEQFRAIHAQMTDPHGPIQDMLAFAFEALENPKEMSGQFVARAHPGLSSLLPQGLDLSVVDGGRKLTGSVAWSGSGRDYEDFMTGSLSSKLHEQFPGVTHQFARDTMGTEMHVLGQQLPVGDVGGAVSTFERQLEVDGVPENDRAPTMLALSKLMTQEMFAPLLVQAGTLTNDEGAHTRFVMRGDVGQAMNSIISLKRDEGGDGYIITYQQKAPLKALTFGTEGLNLDNGLSSTVDMEVSVRVSSEDLRNGRTTFSVVDGPRFSTSLEIDPNNYRLD